LVRDLERVAPPVLPAAELAAAREEAAGFEPAWFAPLLTAPPWATAAAAEGGPARKAPGAAVRLVDWRDRRRDAGFWAQALAEFRAARRMGSRSPLLALIADCERGLGRPERAIELARGPEAAELSGDDADELRIVAAGARADLGQLEQALTILATPQLDPGRTGATAARLFYAYADTLLALDRKDEALQWFLHSAAADVDGVTDAEDRVDELG
jgi:hypothetical protein